MIITDTIMSGDTLVNFAQRLSTDIGCIILGIVAMSDRGIGGLPRVEALGYPVRVLFDKGRILRNLDARFGSGLTN